MNWEYIEESGCGLTDGTISIYPWGD